MLHVMQGTSRQRRLQPASVRRSARRRRMLPARCALLAGRNHRGGGWQRAKEQGKEACKQEHYTLLPALGNLQNLLIPYLNMLGILNNPNDSKT